VWRGGGLDRRFDDEADFSFFRNLSPVDPGGAVIF